MRKLVLAMSMSLDGFIADPKGGGEWMFRTQSEEGRKWVAGKIGSAGLHLAGSNTFKQWVPFWPKQAGPAAEAMNGIAKAVFTRSGDIGPIHTDGSPQARVWSEAEVIGGDLKPAIARLKEKNAKFILAQGGIAFAQHLVTTGLVDEYWLVSHPVALGIGQPLFNKLAQPLPLKVIESKAFATGATWVAYQPVEK
jgi:dihydrofolate reductase